MTATLLDRRRYLQEHLDHVRRLLIWEPRGHHDMYGCVLTPPVTEDAQFGVLFMHSDGYSTMCGHGIIGLVTTLIETGRIAPASPETAVAFDTPAGLVRARARVAGGRVRDVTFRSHRVRGPRGGPVPLWDLHLRPYGGAVGRGTAADRHAVCQ